MLIYTSLQEVPCSLKGSDDEDYMETTDSDEDEYLQRGNNKDDDLMVFFSQVDFESVSVDYSLQANDAYSYISPELQPLFDAFLLIVSLRFNLSVPAIENIGHLYMFLSVLEKDPCDGFRSNYKSVIESVYVSYNFYLRGVVLLKLLQQQSRKAEAISAQEEKDVIALATRGTSDGLTVLSTFSNCNLATKRDGESRLPKLQESKHVEEHGICVTYQASAYRNFLFYIGLLTYKK